LRLIELKNFQMVKVVMMKKMVILFQIQQTTMTVLATAIKLMIMTTIILTELETFHWQLKWMFTKVEYQGENSPVNEDFYRGILFGGDQVTVCRSRGAQSARSHDDSSIGGLEGLTAVAHLHWSI